MDRYRIAAQISVLKDIEKEYPCSTVENARRQLESRLEYYKE